MEMNKVIKGLFVAGALLVAGGAFAATSTGLGPTSTGTIDINVGVGDQIQISALADINGPYVPGTDFTGSSPACVYRNGGTGDFDVTMTSSNGAGTVFNLLEPGLGTLVPYDVTFQDGVSGVINMDNNTLDNTNFTNANTVSPTCNSSPQSTISIRVLDTDLAGAGAGTYSDILTILVAPR